MKYVIASVSVTDEIRFAGGNHVEKVAGGAGIYALCGIKLWDDEVLIATGVGSDYEELYGDWYRRNQLSMEGLIVKHEKTPYTIIQYFEDGEREETPKYGLDHFQKIEIQPEELKPYFGEAKGIYIFKNSNPEFWKKILEYKRGSSAKVMWEIANDATYLSNKAAVREIAACLDIFSINLTESKALLGLESLEEIIREYQSWNIPLVFLRRGSKGSVMITPKEYVMVPAEKDAKIVDPTGGGNSSSGAVLCGFCENQSPEACAKMGNLSAVLCLGQYGVPAVISGRMQQEARRRMEEGKDVK